MRKILALLLAVLLLVGLALSVSADAYIPPERVEGFDMNYAYMENGACKALNTFISNFAEMGLKEFSPDATDEEVIPAVLKHLELNARFYPKYVKKVTRDGNPYMQISGSYFEQRAEFLFGRTISASECPGYQDGNIIVSADHYDGPIQVFASVYGCYPAGDGLYDVYFEVFRIDKDFSGWYTTAYSNLPWDNLTSLGNGNALIAYAGGKTEDTISTSDFTLVEFSMDAEGIPCQGANLPEDYIAPTEAPTQPVTEAPTQPETEAPTEPVTEEPTQKPTFRNEKEIEPEEEEDEEPTTVSGPINITMVLIIILVAAVVLLALLLIVILLVKKKQSQ